MFTGIITDLGVIRAIDSESNKDTRITINTKWSTSDIVMGASIACSGVCLTVVGLDSDGFSVDVSNETLITTTIGSWQEGQRVNLEKSLCMGDELGGHMVSGHVDGTATITKIIPDNESLRLEISADEDLMLLIAQKGSVTLDGVSLTVNKVQGQSFDINIIPHTQSVTTLGSVSVGSVINIEVDMLARYVARLVRSD
tara:strand:- start:23218 stop:23811 length:594 start_codon:yes stop_codon:yes gene_type:complete